ncbi:MAG TPA: mannose-1-phosphate guanylyltransferase [Verrucomicrobiae bacterium]|nr:mannose-1-phosphate guanylyltransferase [Verrucomicrobiae bacterium]
MAKSKDLPRCAVILAGGRGTRFWPRSRKRTPKQLLDIVSEKTMLRETADRLRPLFPPKHLWVVTNDEQAPAIRRELLRVPRAQILAEPLGRNTAAAIGLAAIHLAKRHGDALMAVLPADHYIADAARYRKIVRAAMALASTPSSLVVLGIPPTGPETGFGYIERAGQIHRRLGVPAYSVERFTEKPDVERARKYLAGRKHFWNAGMFFWRVSTFLECLREFLPQAWAALQDLQDAIGTANYAHALHRIYSRLKNISVDYAVMEPATHRGARQRVFVLPADIGWSDIGSWAAVYELLAREKDQNVTNSAVFTSDASGNFIWTRRKFAALVGVTNLIVVDTGDALLVCPRDRAQDVGKIVAWLEQNGRADLL